jgi:hypothetical protein
MSTSIESSNDLSDPNISNKIELFIQQNENITIPSIIFEYISKESIDFESNDLKNFYLQFGEIENFEVKGKISIVLFKTFFAANVCKEFLQNENNFKNDMKKDFIVRWFNLETDLNLISNENKQLYQNISNKNSIHLKKNNINMAINVNMNINMNNINNMNVNLMRNNQILSNNLNRNNNLNNYQNMMNIAAMNNLNILSNNTPNRNINMQNLYYNNMIHGMNGFNNNNNNNNNNGNNNNNNNNINQNLNGNIMNHKLNNHNNNINNNNNNNNNFINNNNFNNYNVIINVGNNPNLIMENTLLDMNKPQSSKAVYMNINPIVSANSSSKELDLNKENQLSNHEEMTKKFQLSTFFSDDFSSYVNVFIQCFLNSKRIKNYFTNLSNEKIEQNKSSLLSLFYFLQKEMNSKNGNGNNINNCLDNIYKYLKKYTNINSVLNDIVLLILNIIYKANQK